MKRIFTFLFALLSACTFSAYAAIVDGTCGDNLTWTLNTKDSTLTILGTGEMTNYDSSSSAPWYDYTIYIKYVTLPDGLTSIGKSAFESCSGLTSVTIPNSVTSIGDGAFKSCWDLTSITIPNSVTSIGWSAFAYCRSLTSITIPNSVTSIGNSAFYECSSLTSITIPNSVTSIGVNAFAICSSLTSITIPNSVTSIGYYAFGGCSSLSSVTIPNSVTSIGEVAFRGCSALTSITIPNSVTSIGNMAFFGCSALTSVTLGKNLTSIVGAAFGCCYGIQEVTSYAATPPAAVDCGLNQTATLYVPAEYVGIYSNTIWWEDFKEIRAIDPNLVGGNKDLTLVFKNQDNTQISTQSITVMFPPAPVIEGFTFLYWLPVAEPVEDKITLQAVYKSNSPTAAPEVFVNPANPAQKLIRNGQVYILHEEKMYTISGQVVK